VLQARIGETSYASYTLEDAFELMPGNWVFEIWQGNRKLATQSFRIEGDFQSRNCVQRVCSLRRVLTCRGGANHNGRELQCRGLISSDIRQRLRC
jgi:hypothetical protein